MENTGAEAILISDPHNMQYFSGFRGGEGIVYVSRRRRAVITDSRYTEAAEKESTFEILEETRQHKRLDILRECLEADGAECVAYEDKSLHCDDFRVLEQGLENVSQWIPLGARLAEERRIKTPEELEKMARAEAISDLAFSELLKRLRAGMSELEVAAELEYHMKRNGGQGLAFDTIAASGLHSSMPHAVPTAKKLEEGDFLTMDFGCRVDGYCADMTRTVVIGRADEEQKKIYATVLKAQESALAFIRAGVTGEEVDAVARTIISEAGYGKCFGHALGHSVGLFIHEEPRLSPGSGTVLEKNMIETIEPGIYVPGFGGVRIEDMVAVTEDGCRNFTSSPKELLEIG